MATCMCKILRKNLNTNIILGLCNTNVIEERALACCCMWRVRPPLWLGVDRLMQSIATRKSPASQRDDCCYTTRQRCNVCTQKFD